MCGYDRAGSETLKAQFLEILQHTVKILYLFLFYLLVDFFKSMRCVFELFSPKKMLIFFEKLIPG